MHRSTRYPLTRALHLLVLWSFAVAQPLYSVLRENREFFVAHRTAPADLLVFVALLTLILPATLCAICLATAHISVRAGDALHLGLVAILLTAFASQILVRTFEMPAVPHFALAAAVGMLGAWLYATTPAIRTFFTYLGPSVLIFPALFVLHPSMRTFAWPADDAAGTVAIIPPGSPPIVMVVFDQLPLTSLLSESGGIDPRYPNFAALADDATWFRNATTVAELTGWAMPAIASGGAPQRSLLPTSHDYPANLFTALGGAYRHEVIEPVTHLCPERLCQGDTATADRLATHMLDASIVYLHTALPGDLRALLPPLTQDWKNFAQGQHWQMRWISARDADRREGPRRFVQSISRSDPQPTFYFLHALLPHEPYMYLRSGQTFTDNPRLFGLRGTGQWVQEPWPVVQAYAQHLLQLQYVDTILGRLIERLKAEGLYDKALIIITGDHGVSFRPGRPFKSVDRENLADIMAVPLFVKLPGQQDPVISDRNVQTIDIVPTIADILKADLPWHPAGRSAFASDPPPATKFIRYLNATRQTTVNADDFAAIRQRAVRRKFKLFPADNADMTPATADHAELLGREVKALDRSDDAAVRVVVDQPASYLRFDPAAPRVAGILSGRVVDRSDHETAAALAIAVNGTIRATTRTYQSQSAGHGGFWTAYVPPRHFRPGANDVEVFVLRDESAGVRLERAYSTNERPEMLNLVSSGARDYWSVVQRGFYGHEGNPNPYQWTNGKAEVVAPRDPKASPQSLRIGIAKAPPGMPLTIAVNGCTVYSGPIVDAPWFRTFALGRCRAAATQGLETRITLTSPVARESSPGSRMVGVAVEAVNLLDDPWPVPAAEAAKTLATVETVKPARTPLATGSMIDIEIANRGESVWMGPKEGVNPRDRVDIVLQWRPHHGDGPSAEQRMALPYTFYPEDRTIITVPVVVPEPLRRAGPWDLTIAPGFQDGRPIKVEPRFTLEVRDPG